MKYSIAAVSFLNTIPLVDGLTALAADGIDLQFDLPSRLAGRLESGAADAALVPVVEVLRGRATGLVGGTGIACAGAVDSVKLFHRGPRADLRRVQTDRGSRSSVALLQILLAETAGCRPARHETEPQPGVLPAVGEGLLVIGDRCFAYEMALAGSKDHGIEAWDLGAAWWDLTGLPFVFAVWAVSAAFLDRTGAEDVARLSRLLAAARDAGLERLDELAAREAAQGRLGHKGEATAEAVAYYFRESLRYRLGDEEMAGLARFHELCIKHGIVPDGPPPVIL